MFNLFYSKISPTVEDIGWPSLVFPLQLLLLVVTYIGLRWVLGFQGPTFAALSKSIALISLGQWIHFLSEYYQLLPDPQGTGTLDNVDSIMRSFITRLGFALSLDNIATFIYTLIMYRYTIL